MERRQIFLNSLRGSDFEQLCAEIYRLKGYYVENTQYVGDEGRDLIMTTPSGETVIAECKHWPNGTVGRPVIQKLHSAVMTYPASRGLVITTGTFSRQAMDYVQALAESIHLVDGTQLSAIASGVGVDLLEGSRVGAVLSVPPTGTADINTRLIDKLFSRFISSPSKAADLVLLTHREVGAKSLYRVQYSIHQEFYASNSLLHKIDVENAYLFMDGETGQKLSVELSNFLSNSQTVDYEPKTGLFKDMRPRPFRVSPREISDQARDFLAQRYTVVIRYQTRRNQDREKQCTPSVRNIHLSDIRQMFVPENRLKYRILEQTYDIELLDNGRDLVWSTSSPLFRCRICQAAVDSQLLCNVCGAVAHKPSLIMPHSFRCKSCQKTLCKDCAYWIPRWRSFKSIVCYGCGDEHRVLRNGSFNKLV